MEPPICPLCGGPLRESMILEREIDPGTVYVLHCEACHEAEIVCEMATWTWRLRGETRSAHTWSVQQWIENQQWFKAGGKTA